MCFCLLHIKEKFAKMDSVNNPLTLMLMETFPELHSKTSVAAFSYTAEVAEDLF